MGISEKRTDFETPKNRLKWSKIAGKGIKPDSFRERTIFISTLCRYPIKNNTILYEK